MGDDWDPQPAKLREGEHPDVSAHTRANLAAIKKQEEWGTMPEGTHKRAAARHGIDVEDAEEGTGGDDGA